ncbi:MAG: DUF3127 domain-containing protein [Bacteroidia bacterium]|nr:DUF3127 domain-containing protein [Bacteroidia bacterium]
MELVGKIKKVMDTQVVSDKFKKREFVLSTDLNTPYPQHILFQTTQEKCALLDALKPNDEVKVTFNIRGREWTSPQDGQVKYFVTLEAWRIDKLTPVAPGTTPESSSTHYTPSENISTSVNTDTSTDISTEGDDLPF